MGGRVGGLEPLQGAGGGGAAADGIVGGNGRLQGAFGREAGELAFPPGDLGRLDPPGSWGAALPGMRPHPSGASALVGRDPAALAWCVDGLPPGPAEPGRARWSLGSQPLHRTPSSPATRDGRVRRNLRRRVKARPDPASLSVAPPPWLRPWLCQGQAGSSRLCGRLLPLRTETVGGAFPLGEA